MASVSGRRMMNVDPSPSFVSTSIDPLSASIRVRTMSMPTPRPEMFEICFAVLNPGCQMKSVSSRGLREAACSAETSPRATARSRIFSTSIPPPSSLIEMMTLLPRCEADSRTVAISGLPRRSRTSAGSIPWSMALRTRCTSGSPSSSIIRLSSSVFSPAIWRVTLLPSSLAMSRTDRLNRFKSGPTGTIRVLRTPRCRLSATLVR